MPPLFVTLPLLIVPLPYRLLVLPAAPISVPLFALSAIEGLQSPVCEPASPSRPPTVQPGALMVPLFVLPLTCTQFALEPTRPPTIAFVLSPETEMVPLFSQLSTARRIFL